MKENAAILGKISNLLLPLCFYYIVLNAVMMVGVSFFQSMEEKLPPVIFKENSITVLTGFVRLCAYLLAGLTVYRYYIREKNAMKLPAQGGNCKTADERSSKEGKQTNCEDFWGSSKAFERSNCKRSSKEGKQTNCEALGGSSKAFEGDSLNRQADRKKEPAGFGYMQAAAMALSGGVLSVALNMLWGMLPWFQNNAAYEAVSQSQYSLPLWLGLILYGLVSPWAEEVMFRGVLYNCGSRYFGRRAGIYISTLLFGLFHGNVVQISYALVMGLIMAVIYKRYGKLAAPLAFHCGANITIFLLH